MTAGQATLAEKWRRFQKRPREDRSLILRAAVILPLTRAGLRVFGFRRWKELIEKFFLPVKASKSMPYDLQHELAGRSAQAVRSAELHGPASPNCLERSMTLWWLLRRRGVDGELMIGARMEDGQFKAHAWVELDGVVLNDSAEIHNHYARFDAPIAAAENPNLRAGAAGKAN